MSMSRTFTPGKSGETAAKPADAASAEKRAAAPVGAFAIVEEGIIPREQNAMGEDRGRDVIDEARGDRAIFESAHYGVHAVGVG